MAKRRRADGERRSEERGADIRVKADPGADFFELWYVATGPSGPERDEALWRMRAIASSGMEFTTLMCSVYYASRCSRHDPLEALRWAVKGMESGDEGAASWLAFFLMRDDDPDPCRSRGYLEQAPRPRGDGWFDTDPYLLSNPAFRVLLSITGTDKDGATFYTDDGDERRGFENDVFSFVPGDPEKVMPGESCWAMFLYRPTGARVVWRGGFEDAAASMPITVGEGARIWLDCIASVVRQISRQGPDDDAEASGWNGHPRVILDREDAIRRALRLPTTDFYGDKVIGCVDDIFVIFSRGDERMAVAFEGGRTLTVDGRTVPIDRSAAERLFYAAGLADSDGEGVYGNPRSDGAEWSVHFNYGGRKRVISYGGTVIPPFIGTILDAMEGLSERTPGLRSILDALSVFPRVPCRQLHCTPPRPEFIDIYRIPAGEEVAGSGCRVAWQELTVHDGGAELRTCFRGAGGSNVSLDYELESDIRAAGALLDSMEGRKMFCADPSVPYSVRLYQGLDSWEFAGPDEKAVIAEIQGITEGGMAGLEDRIRRDLREKGLLAEGEVMERPILVFDGLEDEGNDYYGLRGGRSSRSMSQDRTVRSPSEPIRELRPAAGHRPQELGGLRVPCRDCPAVPVRSLVP